MTVAPAAGELDGGGADRAGGGVDQDRVTLRQPELAEGDVGRLGGRAEAAGDLAGHARRLGRDLLGRDDDVFGVGAEQVEAEHLVTHRDLGDPRADLVDHPGELVAGDPWQVRADPGGTHPARTASRTAAPPPP